MLLSRGGGGPWSSDGARLAPPPAAVAEAGARMRGGRGWLVVPSAGRCGNRVGTGGDLPLSTPESSGAFTPARRLVRGRAPPWQPAQGLATAAEGGRGGLGDQRPSARLCSAPVDQGSSASCRASFT